MRHAFILKYLHDADNALAEADHSPLKVAIEALRTVVGELVSDVGELSGEFSDDSSPDSRPDWYDHPSDEYEGEEIPFEALDENAHVDEYLSAEWAKLNAVRLAETARLRAIAEKALRKAGKIK